MNNTRKTFISFSDDNISLIVVKNDNGLPILIHEQKYDLEKNYISNGYIIEANEITKILSMMINEAINKSGVLKEIYISLDIKQVYVKDFNYEKIKVPNQVLDEKVWNNEILKEMKISDTGEQYIFGINVSEWIINGKSYYSLNTQYQAKTVDIKGKMYLINRVLFDGYMKVLKSLKITPKLIQPFFMCFPTLVKSNRNDNCETFVNLNNNGLILTTTKGNQVISNICIEEFSLKKLYESIMLKTNMSIDQIKNSLDFLPDIGPNNIEINIANNYSRSYLEIKTVTNKDIYALIIEFVKNISNVISDKFISSLKKKVGISVNRISFFPTNKKTEMILNMILHSLQWDSKIISYANECFNKIELNPNYLFAQYVINQNQNNQIIDITNFRAEAGVIRKD